MNKILLTIALGALVAALAYFTLRDFDASALSVHGWIALGLGSALSLLVGAGLMALMFHSARKGYDERIGVDKSGQNQDAGPRDPVGRA